MECNAFVVRTLLVKVHRHLYSAILFTCVFVDRFLMIHSNLIVLSERANSSIHVSYCESLFATAHLKWEMDTIRLRKWCPTRIENDTPCAWISPLYNDREQSSSDAAVGAIAHPGVSGKAAASSSVWASKKRGGRNHHLKSLNVGRRDPVRQEPRRESDVDLSTLLLLLLHSPSFEDGEECHALNLSLIARLALLLLLSK